MSILLMSWKKIEELFSRQYYSIPQKKYYVELRKYVRTSTDFEHVNTY